MNIDMGNSSVRGLKEHHNTHVIFELKWSERNGKFVKHSSGTLVRVSLERLTT